LESYTPESRTITVKTFEDNTYPFKIGKWKEFEKIEFPIIKKIEIDQIVQHGEKINIKIETENADSILYFLVDSKGKIQASEKLNINENKIIIDISSNITKNLQIGANSIKIFVISDSVLKPDFYESSFLVSKNNSELPHTLVHVENIKNQVEYSFWIIPIVLIIGIGVYLKIKYQSKP
jgi:peptide/nickel transport system substrate-binding protein